jgi:hypothetical protein
LIVLQLKSSQEKEALKSISDIIKTIQKKFGYRIKGHEIHQIKANMDKTSLQERVNSISSFCATNEIEYLTYHTPIIKQNIYDSKWNQIIINSIFDTILESKKVASEVNIKRVTIICHLSNYIHKNGKEAQLTKETKVDVRNMSRRAFLHSFVDNMDYSPAHLRREQHFLAIENSYPKCYSNSIQKINLFHPKELVEFERYDIKTTLDLSHYQLYSNYLLYGKGNIAGDLDREIYKRAPSWEECIKILGNSLVQLHINDAVGFDYSGEGLRLGRGEIPISDILRAINSSERVIQGTIEIIEGHLYKARFQEEAVDWLLTNMRHFLG